MTDRLLHRLEKDFLNFLHDWHAERNYVGYRELTALEEVEVDDARDVDDQYFRHNRRITLNVNQGIRRKRFTGMHEIVHHLFKTAESGRFILTLERLFPDSLKAQSDYEEVFVNSGGFQLIIPRPTFQTVCEQYEDDAKRAQVMAIKVGCSFAAAGQRIALAVDRPVGGIVMDINGNVSDCFANNLKKYLTAGKDFQIGSAHSLLQKPFEANRVEFFEAKIPYKRSLAEVKRYMQALYDDKRGQIIVFFNAPHSRKRELPKLFKDFY